MSIIISNYVSGDYNLNFLTSEQLTKGWWGGVVIEYGLDFPSTTTTI